MLERGGKSPSRPSDLGSFEAPIFFVPAERIERPAARAKEERTKV
jgi:hypothetical protein